MFFLLGTSIQGKTLGIVGLGQIGAATARRARAFGMDVIYSGRRAADPALERELGARRVDLDELLATLRRRLAALPADRPTTRHLIDGDRLRQMKPIGVPRQHHARPGRRRGARWPTALRDGVDRRRRARRVRAASPRCIPALLELENVVLLPHLGSATIETRTAMAMLAAQQRDRRARRRRPADARELTPCRESMYELGGGAAGMRRLTDAFYRLVFADDLLGAAVPRPRRPPRRPARDVADRAVRRPGGAHRAPRRVRDHEGRPPEPPDHASRSARGGRELMYRAERRGGHAGGVPQAAPALHRGRHDVRDAVSWPADRRWPR